MKKRISMLFTILLLAVAILCCGCADVLEKLEDERSRQEAQTMVDAILSDDFTTAYSLVSGVCSEGEFRDVFAQLKGFLGEVDSYELKLLSVYTNSALSNGKTRKNVSSEYEMTAGERRIILDVVIDDEVGMNVFRLTPYEKTDYFYTGTPSTMKGANTAQWVILLLSLLSYGITLYAIVDCAKRQIPRKVLWILILIFGLISLGFTAGAGSFRLNFNLAGLLSYSALIYYGSGTTVFRLILPVGAIVYFAMRNSLVEKAQMQNGYDIPVQPVDETQSLQEGLTQTEEET